MRKVRASTEVNTHRTLIDEPFSTCRETILVQPLSACMASLLAIYGKCQFYETVPLMICISGCNPNNKGSKYFIFGSNKCLTYVPGVYTCVCQYMYKECGKYEP